MKVHCVTLLLLGAVICSAQSSATGSVDFTGRWISESIRASSSIGSIPTTKGRLYLVVTQTNDQVRLKQLSEAMGNNFREAVHHLDGRGEDNKDYRDSIVLHSKTQLKGGKLIIEGTQTITGSTRKSRIKEVWELSRDGNKLTIKPTTNSGAEVNNVKIYRREK